MALKLSKALVTGGAGFIGSHLVEALVREGCAVTVLDNLTTGHLSNLASVRHAIEFVQGDIQDDGVLAKVSKNCDAVFHQAAIVSVTQTIKDPVASAQVNELGTIRVLEAARRNNVPRVVLASSSAVYGDTPQSPKTESMVPAPMSPYAVQKLTNEYYADLFNELFGVETVCLRYFNVYGPRQDPSSPYSGVISIFMMRGRDGQAPLIHGDGRQTRDFIHVQDVVQANLLAAINPSAPGRVFNIGTGQSVQINSLWVTIAAIAANTLSAQYGPARKGDIIHSMSSIQAARQILGFEPLVPLDKGLRSTFDWYRAA